MEEKINCENCGHKRDVNVESNFRDSDPFADGMECNLGHQIKLGGDPGCDGKDFKPME